MKLFRPVNIVPEKLIVFFMIVFILSLSNSIFINQLGYYACLVLLLVRFYLTKENPFSRTGLELAFILFISAEIISAVLSEYSSAAFTNAIKRSLLLGTIYITLASSFYLSRTKKYFKAYVIGSIITCLIYLYHSYSYFVNNLFSKVESGPSVFQNTITASEIASFLVVFLFAFFFNEKTTWRNKLLILAGLIISSAALYATYKRTGWMGTAFGILTILLMKKQWKLLVPVFGVLLIYLILQRDSSSITSYHLNDNPQKITEIQTGGRAWDVLTDGPYLLCADYTNGVVLYRDSEELNRLETPSPVLSLARWNDTIFIASLMDSRFILFERNEQQLEAINEFVSSGKTTSYTLRNNYLYVLDSDSGLTIFKNPINISDTVRKPSIINKYVFADTSFLLTYSGGSGFRAFRLDNGIPSEEIRGLNPDPELLSVFYAGDYIYTADLKHVKLFRIRRDTGSIEQVDSSPSKHIFLYWKSAQGKLFAMSSSGLLTELQFPSEKIIIKKEWNFGINASNFFYNDGRIYVAAYHSSRLLSFIDLNHPTNITRINLWKTGFRILRDYPLFGVGDIGLELYHKKYKGYYEKEIHGHLHNNFVHILATLGVFGLIAVLFLFIRIIVIDLKIYNYLKDVPFASSYSLGALGTFVAFLFSGLTEFNFGDHEIITLVWFIFGLNLAFYKNHLSVHHSEFENGNY